MTEESSARKLRQAVILVATLNLAYFAFEFGVAIKAGSVSLYADSIDFLEDAALNLLVLLGLRLGTLWRGRLAVFMAALLLVPSSLTLWAATQHLLHRIVPHAESMGLVGAGALCVNLFCAFHLSRFQHHAGSLTKAAFLSARNDALANVAILIAGFLTYIWPTPWPDLAVGVGILVLNGDAVMKVLKRAREEKNDLAEA